MIVVVPADIEFRGADCDRKGQPPGSGCTWRDRSAIESGELIYPALYR